ncbi:DNA polymerase I [soil metagenome]
MSEKAEPKKLAIIDGKSVFYRGYYAMRDLSTKDGTPTGGVYGFAVMAVEVIKRLKPDYVCVAWDKPKTNIRKRLEMYPEYKAGRKPPPPDFYEQIPVLHELLEAFGWPLFELDDYEADDIMGTFAVQATEQGIDTQLITSDLDVLQLVNPNVHVYAMKKGLSNIELFKPESFIAKYGITPEQFLDLKALKGDSSDNIPGVPGVGEKTALQLLKDYKTLDGVYDNLALLKENTRKKLEAGKESAHLSKKLAAIWTDAPVQLDVSKMNGDSFDVSKVKAIFEKLEFRTLLRQLPASMNNGKEIAHSLPSAVSIPADKIILITQDSQLKDISLEGEVIMHGRCAGAHGKQPLFVSVAKLAEQKTYVLKLPELSAYLVCETFADIVSVTGYDVKAVYEILHEIGLPMSVVGHDVFVGAFLVNSLRREQTLTELANADIGYDGTSFEGLDHEEYTQRAGEITAVIRALHTEQLSALKDLPKVQKLAKEIEWPVIPVLARMEHEGIKLDTTYLNRMSKELEDDISDVQQEIYGYADREFNVSSPKQLADVLFMDMKLPTVGIKKGKTGYSTAASELGKLRGQHPIIDLISRYREYTKLKNTYVDTLPKLVDERSRLHTTFNLTIAQTGRLSSTDPNLQNIPVRTPLGKRIRTAFAAEPGSVLVSADYSQFELRLAACLAEDTELIQMFNDGADIHTMTAAQIYERHPEEVTKTMRRDAKVINFGILYGMSPHGLVAATGMTYSAAKMFIDKYFELRKPILDYTNDLIEKARKDGYVETLFGRRRPTPDIKSSNFIVRQAAERAAINMPIQGTEADLMKLAMTAVDKILPSGALQLLQIHDSILVECRQADAKRVADAMQKTMEAVHSLPVRLQVDVTTGDNWGEL